MDELDRRLAEFEADPDSGATLEESLCENPSSRMTRRFCAQIGGCNMVGQTRKARAKVKEIPLAEVKNDLSRYLREAAKGEIVITRHGKPADVLIGFKSEDDWFDYPLENNVRIGR